MSASLLDLVSKKSSVDGLVGLAEWLEGKGSAREADKVRDLAEDIRRVRDAAERGTTAGVLAVLRSHIGDGGLDASATALDQWSHGTSAAHGDDLDALAELADLESDPSRFPAWLSEQLSAPADIGGVTLASIHAVKGREWPHVVVHHATAGLLPHRLAEDIEEERRVFHVALTRCRSSRVGHPRVAAVPVPPRTRRTGRTDPARRTKCGGAPGPRRCFSTDTAAASCGSSNRSATRFGRDRASPTSGHDHEVIELTGDSVRSLVGGGPATTMIAFGTSVTVGGQPAVLVHPRFAEAWERLRAWRAERSQGRGRRRWWCSTRTRPSGSSPPSCQPPRPGY